MAEARLSPRAQRDLENLFDYTIKLWGLAQAMRYADLIEAACADLAHAPQQAQSCDHIRPDHRRRELEQHMIYFRQASYGIAVMRILHQRLNYPPV